VSRVELHRAYKFRLYPTPAQVAELSEWERQLRRLYNLAHEQRLISLTKHLRPKSPDADECRSCGAPKVDETEHGSACLGASRIRDGWVYAQPVGAPRGGYHKGECRECGAKRRLAVHHTTACAFVDYYRQGREMTELLEGDDQLARVVCSARQEVLRDLDKAWQRWRKMPGFGKPRFKRRTDSCRIYFSTPKAWKLEGGHLSFTGAATTVGAIKMRQDRNWPASVQFSSCHVVRDVDEWYAVFPLTFVAEVARPKGGAVGINRGAVHAIADSTGRFVDSPRYYARALGVIRHRARLLDRKVPSGHAVKPSPTKYRGLNVAEVDRVARVTGFTPGRVVTEALNRGGVAYAECALAAIAVLGHGPERPLTSDGRNREKARKFLALAHQRVRRQREWFLHNESAHYARTYSKIAIEDWSTKEMTASEPQGEETRRVTRSRNRSILDVGWYELGRQLAYKTEATGAEFAQVDPGLKETETNVPKAIADARDVDVSGMLRGEAGISGTCSKCGGLLRAPASGHADAECEICLNVEVGDVNAAVNVLKRAMFPGDAPPASGEKPKVSIGIKGRQKKKKAA
jgi:transposase